MRQCALTVIWSFLFAVAPGVLAEAPKPLPKNLPPYGELKPFKVPQPTTQILPNGLTLWMVPRPGFPKVSYTLAVRGGHSADPADLPGLSDLLTATLDQGTTTRSARQIAEELQAAVEAL